jgi:Xaa-Pro dipeptidase
MERREFVAALGAAAGAMGITDFGMGNGRASSSPTLHAAPRARPQEPSLSPAVLSRRVEHAQAELKTRKWDCLIATPGANYQYFTGDNPGRSERLIALILPVTGAPAIVCPEFEVARIKSRTSITDVTGWEEKDDPVKLAAKAARKARVRGTGTIALESSTEYATFVALKDALGGWRFEDARPVTERLRMVKSGEEIDLLRRAIAITEDAIIATFAALAPGMRERDVADRLAGEMEQRGAEGGGLVQFGPSSAMPHGSPTSVALATEMPVLIDCGCRVGGYISDITRTIWFGERPSDEFKTIFNLVHDAQTAAIGLGRPLLTQGQQMDRAARQVITAAGYGAQFTHRLGHGIGLEGHEPPYLVEGSETRLEPGMVFTIEPGIYQTGKFGVRIEDDCIMTETGIEVLSHRPAKL